LKKGTWLSALVLLAFLAGCGAGTTPPNEVVNNYVTALAEGNFQGACAMLPNAQRAALARAGGTRPSCVAAYNRCVPKQPTNTSKDQTQLFYANVQSTITGSNAVAELSGTTVATALKQVTLVERHGVWSLTSYGTGLKACVLGARRRVKR
jgi:hypothetical protein